MRQDGPFVADIKEIRRRAREHLDQGAVTKNYGGGCRDGGQAAQRGGRNRARLVRVYKYHATMAVGIASESVKAEFAQHAIEEMQHLEWLAERINQLGGKPNLDSQGLLSRSSSEYVEGDTLVDMIRENLVAERIAIESYRADDPGLLRERRTRRARILLELNPREGRRARQNDMHADLTVAHSK